MNTVIRVDKLGKCYRLEPGGEEGDYRYRTLREGLTGLAKWPLRRWRQGIRAPRPEPFWALQNVCFDVAPGEVVGIIGRNGAGKSTLLKILSRITNPSRGRAELDGRVGSLLEVGTGFHPELSGRENIYLNGAILGMRRREIQARMDEIVAFAEVERFLETPVKRYSSGMYMRLAFAVAAHLEPEILVVDEVLAVGDAAFQKKCLQKMGDVAGQGRTVLFVSHNMGAVQTLCGRALLLSAGQIQAEGNPRDVVAEYLKAGDTVSATPLAHRTDRRGVGNFRFDGFSLLDAEQNPRDFAITGEDTYLRVRLRTPPGDGPLPVPLDVAITLRDFQGYKITEVSTFFTGSSPTCLRDCRELTCRLPRLSLLAGQYRIDLWCGTSAETQDCVEDAGFLRVEAGNYFGNTRDVRLPVAQKHGCIMIPQQWGPTGVPE